MRQGMNLGESKQTAIKWWLTTFYYITQPSSVALDGNPQLENVPRVRDLRKLSPKQDAIITLLPQAQESLQKRRQKDRKASGSKTTRRQCFWHTTGPSNTYAASWRLAASTGPEYVQVRWSLSTERGSRKGLPSLKGTYNWHRTIHKGKVSFLQQILTGCTSVQALTQQWIANSKQTQWYFWRCFDL